MSNAFSEIHCLTTGPSTLQDAASSQLPHILLVVDGFPGTLGGGERVVLRLASLLPSFGYRVSILTFLLDPAGEFQISSAPCPIYLLPLRKTYNLDAWRSAFALRRFIQQQGIRIVQTFFESADLWAGFFAKTLTSAKVIWSRRDMGILRGAKHAKAYRLLKRLPDAVFAVSEQVRQHAITVDGILPERVHTIHNGLELQPITSSPSIFAGQRATITTVGNIRRVKGHDILVRAAAQVVAKFPATQFTIAGEILDPGYFEELQQLVREMHLSENFRFLGRITDLPSHLRSADGFILPSRSEGFSNALIEAMAAGLPCVATDVGGNGEALRSGIEGWLVPSEDVDALAGAILEMLADPSLAVQMGTRAQSAAHSLFTAETMARKTTKVYRDLLNLT